MKKLDLVLLGTPTVLLDGEKLSGLSNRKAQALLYYVALAGKPVGRDRLTALLWPKMKPKAAKHNLRTTLNTLKQLLDPYLEITTRTVAFHSDMPVSSDVKQLRMRLELAIAEEDAKALLDAVMLYQGEFLQGFHLRNADSFEEWLLQQREQWHLTIIQALENLILICIHQGEYRIGIDASRKLLAMEPWSEAVHRQLMIFFALNGQRSRALQQYEICCSVLAEESGIKPAPETTMLHQQILAGQFSHPTFLQHEMTSADSNDVRALASHKLLSHDLMETQIPTADALEKSLSTNEAPFTPVAPLSIITPNNLHTPLSSFIGRQQERSHIIDQLLTADNRLLTVTGAGGVGKSSLALAVGHYLLKSLHEFRDGIFFVSLAEIEVTDNGIAGVAPEQTAMTAIVTAIAQALGYHFERAQSLQTQLIEFLRYRRLLLILDNFDHLLDYAGIIVDLLTNIPSLRVLVTSRVRLNIRGETVFQLRGLSLETSFLLSTSNGGTDLLLEPSSAGAVPTGAPTPLQHLDNNQPKHVSEAVLLFISRVKNVDPMFEPDRAALDAMAQLCQVVAGLPLAIEMAAAWIPFYSCEEIARRLTNENPDVDLLVSPFQDQPARHRTLQRVFDDSWKMLSEPVQLALARLSVFSGHFTREATQAVANVLPIALMELQNHSLLYVNEQSRYSLHPLIKHFAANKWNELAVTKGETRAQLYRLHCHYYLQLLANFANQSNRKDEIRAIKQLRQNHGELARAWQFAIQQNEWSSIRSAMIGLFRYLELTNQFTEGKAFFSAPHHSGAHHSGAHHSATHHSATHVVQDDALELNSYAPVMDWLHTAYCHFLRRLAEHGQARSRLEAQLATTSVTAMTTAQISSATTADQERLLALQVHTFAQCVLGWVYYEQGEYSAASDCFKIANQQAGQLNDYIYLVDSFNGLGSISFSLKEYKDARSHYRRALTLAQEHSDLHYTAIILGNLAAHAQTTNALRQAEQYLQMRLEIDQQTQNTRQIAISYHRLGQLALCDDAFAKAETYLRESIAHFEQIGHGAEISHVLLDLSKSLFRQQQLEQAKVHCLRSMQMAMQAQISPRILATLTMLAEIYVAEERKAEALTLLQMVTHNDKVPAVTWRTAQKLQADLVAELPKANLPTDQVWTVQSLQEFGEQLLLRQLKI